ncbi:hypothetical protein SDJN02_23699, partial [Cucurbita argyrosperma subsp. argyrosperma]
WPFLCFVIVEGLCLHPSLFLLYCSSFNLRTLMISMIKALLDLTYLDEYIFHHIQACRWVDCGGGSCNKMSRLAYKCDCLKG